MGACRFTGPDMYALQEFTFLGVVLNRGSGGLLDGRGLVDECLDLRVGWWSSLGSWMC